jgi:hypothetical protein
MLKAMVVAMPSLFAPDPVMILGPDGRDAPLNEGVDLMAEASSTRLRCLIVTLDLGRFWITRSKIRWALARLFPTNIKSSTRCPSLLHFSTL